MNDTVSSGFGPPDEFGQPAGHPSSGDSWPTGDTGPGDEGPPSEPFQHDTRRPRDTAPQRVVIKLRPNALPNTYADRLENQLPEVGVAWEYVRGEYGDAAPRLTIDRVFRGLRGRPVGVRPELLTYYEAVLPADRDKAFEVGKAIITQLRPLDHLIERVYFASPPAPLPQIPCGLQRLYLDTAPLGMAITANRPAGGGVWPRVVHLERVYDPNNVALRHLALAGVAIANGQGGPTEAQYANAANFATEMGHAVCVLGILGGLANPPHCEGLIPAAQVAFATSLARDSEGKWPERIASQIETLTNPANGHMGRGDILLLELQVYGRREGECDPSEPDPDESAWVEAPVELEPDIHEALLQARDRGIIVIEPMGNGGSDVATLRSFGTCEALRPDSSAILTAACNVPAPIQTAPHFREASSNFGDRVVCYSWGAKIKTLKAGDAAAVVDFSKTSGASALVAGVAALVQKAAINSIGRCLTPDEMRQALTQPTPGVPPRAPEEDIGVMPNLAAAELFVQGLPA